MPSKPSLKCSDTHLSNIDDNQLGGLARRLVKYELKGMSFREYLKIAYGNNITGMSLTDLLDTGSEKINLIRNQIEQESHLGPL
jgi:predicted AAA+ superfamily ATPase